MVEVNVFSGSFPGRISKLLAEFGYEVVSVSPCNGRRDVFVVVRRNGLAEKFYVKCRKSPAFDSKGEPVGFFRSFSEQFPRFYEANKELGKFGESVNIGVLEMALGSGVDKLLFCYDDGIIFWCYPKLFLNFAKSNDLIRQQFGSPEVTFSVPFKLLNRFEGESV